MKRLMLLIVLLISLCACARGPQPIPPPKLPYYAWHLSLAAPRHMEVWVETVDVIDQRGLPFFYIHTGVAGYPRQTVGWHVAGSSKPISNVDLPERLFLRWQSLVEPQAYKLRIDIPQWVRDEMVKPETVFCKPDQKVLTLYRNKITLGMAPGGIVKVWVGSGCLEYMEIGRYQAEIEPRGPYLNNKGEYYRAPTPEAKAWIEKNGIPYGSW